MTPKSRDPKPSDKVRVRRAHKRGAYDRETVNAILDSALIAHVGYVFDGYPIVTPMLCWREGDYIYWHGSTASRAMKASIDTPVCLTVTHMDGWVLAKSAFHHSANYRSVMLFGRGEVVSDPDAKTAALKSFMDQQFPERWDTLRPVYDKELKATLIVRMKIDEAAAKTRSEGPKDDVADLALPIWAGVIPLKHQFKSPVPNPNEQTPTPCPEHVSMFTGKAL